MGDTTIGALISRRYGNEVAQRLVGPLLGGIAAGSIDTMSLDAAVPQLAAAAHRSTSLTVALAESLQGAAGSAEPVFAAPPNGMGELIDLLAVRLAERGVEFRLGAPVDGLPVADGIVLTPALKLRASTGGPTAETAPRRTPAPAGQR